jgi:predicted exporter
MLRFFYSWKQALKIISVPFLIILVVVAVFAVNKIDMEFFSVTGLILVFGLGLDYIIYMMENEKRNKPVVECSRSECIETTILEPFATMVSFVTTIISFGALALSSFKPVHLIGLSIFIGLATAYISSFFYGRNKN